MAFCAKLLLTGDFIMRYRLHSLRPARAHEEPVRLKAIVATMFVGLAVFCLLFIFQSGVSSQGETIRIGVLDFQNESGTQTAAAKEIARKLAQQMNAAYKDVLVRPSNKATDATSIEAMTVEELSALGKEQGVQFVVRGGLLAAADETSSGEPSIQLYADIVSVKASTIVSVRAAGNGADKDQALSSGIEHLAESIHQAIASIVSPSSAVSTEATAANETAEVPPGDASLPEDSKDFAAAETDEELQQLIAQAESLIANGSSLSGKRLASLSEALESLKTALNNKVTLLEAGKDSASADQEISRQKEILQASVSAIAESEMPGASDVTDTTDPADTTETDSGDQQTSGERTNLLARIGEYAGDTLNIIQKIQEIRAALRGSSESYEQSESPGADGTDGAVGTDDAASEAIEESTEEISGVVTEMGEPVAGITVTEPESGVKAETDSNGAYALPGVTSGRLAKLVLTKNGKQIATGQIDVARHRSPIADFALNPKTGGTSKSALTIIPATVVVNQAKKGADNLAVFKGVVRDAQGRPAARALVRLGSAMARTNTQGQYAFINFSPGAYKLTVQRSGSRPRTEMVQVAARKGGESRIQLTAADKIPNAANKQSLLVRGSGTAMRGQVVDPQKRPLPRAKITVVQQTRALSVLTGPRGNYLLRDLKPGSYRVLVSKAGYDSTAQALILRVGEGAPRDFQLKKTNSPFIEKALAGRRANRSLSPADVVKTVKRVNRQDRPVSKVISAKEPAVIQIKSGRLRGRVSDSKTRKPVSDATIFIEGRPRAKTDGEGNYGVLELPPGSYHVSVTRAGFSEQARAVNLLTGNLAEENFAMVAEVGSDNTSASRRTPPTVGRAEVRNGQLSGRIVNATTGRPVPGVFVSVAGGQTVTSDREGSFAFNDLAPGPYRLIARKRDFLDGIASLVIRPGETTRANLRLSAKPTNRVR
jgi:hypothetical protein